MPDIKTALSKALNEWEPPAVLPVPEPKVYFAVTTNVCRSSFNYVRDNPGKTRASATKALAEQGFKYKSVSSLLGQMIRQGLIRENNRLLYTTSNEYSPIKSSALARARQENPIPRKKVTLVSKRTGEVFNPKPTAAPAPVEKEWQPSDVIDKLSVRQALALFKELRNILVG